MHTKMLVLGRSGAGKTASLRNLDPKESGIINIDKKQLPFPHTGYNTVMKEGKPVLSESNYVETDRISSVLKTLDVWRQREDIKTIVIDTITHLITSDYVNNAIGKDFKAYQNLGKGIWQILDKCRAIDKNIVIFGHIEIVLNENGDKVIKMKSQGKMIDQFEPESYFSVMLMQEVIKDEDSLRYVLRTQPLETHEKIKVPVSFNGQEPERLFDLYEDNDVAMVLNKLEEFYNN